MAKEKKLVDKNSEMLFIYDAKRCNPNGDMDNENKPRMDWETHTNLVSDVRLKRYIRDYFHRQKNLPIFVRKLGSTLLKAKQALQLNAALKNGEKEEEIEKKDLKKYNKKDLKKIIFDLIDIRLFGATIPFEVETGRGTSETLTGPVQFNWGYSLNNVSLQETKTITSHLSTSSSEEGAGVGKDYRVNYSLIAFHGAINAKVGKTTQLTIKDVELLDEAMIKAIPLNRTRSKIGQTPRVYIRVILKDSSRSLNDLREYISIKKGENLRSIKDVELDFSELNKYLNNNKEKIEKIIYWKNNKTRIANGLNEKSLPLENLNL